MRQLRGLVLFLFSYRRKVVGKTRFELALSRLKDGCPSHLDDFPACDNHSYELEPDPGNAPALSPEYP